MPPEWAASKRSIGSAGQVELYGNLKGLGPTGRHSQVSLSAFGLDEARIEELQLDIPRLVLFRRSPHPLSPKLLPIDIYHEVVAPHGLQHFICSGHIFTSDVPVYGVSSDPKLLGHLDDFDV